MGKISCESCKKSCKGQAIRLQEKYFHVKCFKCKECKKQLAAGGFYSKDTAFFCQDDYQRLYGTRCTVCSKFVEGEVVTALGNTYHIDCFSCTRCNLQFKAGDKVTFTGKDYLCSVCLDLTQSEVTTPATEVTTPVNSASPSKKAKQPLSSSTPRGQNEMDTQLSSPMSDMSDLSTDKENMRNGLDSEERELLSPISTTSGYKSDASSERTLDMLDQTSEVFDDYLGESMNSDHKDRLSPIQNIMSYRSPSPAASTESKVSKKSQDSANSHGSRQEVDYGKFYNLSYLDKAGADKYLRKGPSINPKIYSDEKHFHRPKEFSYKNIRQDFIRPKKKKVPTATLR